MRHRRDRGLFAAIASAMLISAPVQAETFQEALISAYQSHPRLKAERARLREIDETYVQARAQGRFTANAAGDVAFSEFSASGSFIAGAPPQTFGESGTPSQGQFEIIQPLYQGGRVRALKSQSKANIYAGREVLRQSEQGILLATATAYVDVLRDEETARIRRNNVSVLARQGLASQTRFEVGAGSRTDVAQSQSRIAAAEAGLAQADAALASSRATYKQLVGHIPVDLQRVPQFILPASLEEAQLRALENNPQLLAAQFNIDAAKAGIDVAKAAGKPVVSLNGTYGVQRGQIASFDSADQGRIAAQVSIPLFSGGANKSARRQAEQAKRRLGFELKDAERNIAAQTAQLWAQFEAARRVLTASEAQVGAAEIAFEGVELEQSVGTRTALDVLDAEQEVLTAKLAVTDAQRSVDIASFQLLNMMGAFDAVSIRLPIELYDAQSNFEDIREDGLSRFSKKYVPERLQRGDEP